MEQTEDRLRTGRERERIALEIRRCLQNKIQTAGRRKLLLWMFLAMLALSGCGGGTAQTGSTADTAEEAAAAPRETEEVSEAYRKLERASGTIEGRIYTNPYFRLQIAVPEEFSLYGSNVTEQLQGRSRQEAAEAANSYMDMYGRCERDGSLQSVTVLLGNLDSEISPETMDLTIRTAISAVTDTLAAEGAEDIKVTAAGTVFLGKEARTVEISCRKDGQVLLEREIFLTSESYLIEIVFTGATPEEIGLLQKCCSVVR